MISNKDRPRDFDAAEIARDELRKIVVRFYEETKRFTFQRRGLPGSMLTRKKAIEVLEDTVPGDFNDLKATINDIEEKWKENHGTVSLQRIRKTNFHDTKS
jgi:phage gp29-like protein